LLVEFLDDTAYVLASYGHSGMCWPVMAILVLLCRGFFILLLIFWEGVVVRVGMKEIKSWNLNPGFCKLHQEFNSGVRGLV